MRVSFAGGGSDLPPFVPGIGGRIVGSAIDIRVRVLIEPFEHGWVRLESTAAKQTVTRKADEPPRTDLAFRLLEAALAHCGVTSGVRLRVESDLTPGSGLGGSAAVAVAALSALHASMGSAISLEQLYLQATHIERERLRLACGSQDQIFAAFGGVLDLAFGEDGCTRIEPVPVDKGLVRQLEAGLLLVDTLVRRVSGEVIERMAPEAAQQTVTELVSAAAEVLRGLQEGSLELVLQGMQRNAAAKARRDPAANSAAVDLRSVLMCLGARVVRTCGAGAGGHVLIWAPEEHHPAILSAIGPCVTRRPRLAAQGVRPESEPDGDDSAHLEHGGA